MKLTRRKFLKVAAVAAGASQVPIGMLGGAETFSMAGMDLAVSSATPLAFPSVFKIEIEGLDSNFKKVKETLFLKPDGPSAALNNFKRVDGVVISNA